MSPHARATEDVSANFLMNMFLNTPIAMVVAGWKLW